jgi:hypothetical protein
MPIYQTGRTRTLRFEGTISSENAQASGVVPGVYPVKEFKLAVGCQWATIYVYTAIGDAPTLSGGSGRTYIEDFELGATSVDVWNTKPMVPNAYDIDVEGEWYAEVEVEELFYTGDLDPLLYTEIDGTPFPSFGGTAYPDGLAGTTARYYERVVPGSTKTVSATVNGVTTTLTGTVSGSFPPIYEVSYDGQLQLYTEGYAVGPTTPFPGYTTYLVCTDDSGGTVPGAVYDIDWPSGAAAVDADFTGGFSITLSTEGGTPPSSTGSCYAAAVRTVTAKTQYGFRGKYVSVEGGALGGAAKTTALLQDGNGLVAVSGDDPTADFDHWYYSLSADLNTNGYAVGPTDLRSPVRAHLLSFGGDDSRDWRLPFQLQPWHALTVDQDATLTVAANKTITDSDLTVSLTETNWEGYRYFRPTMTTNFAPKTVGVTVGGKRFEATTGANGVASFVRFDLTQPANLPSGFTKDHRDHRFPLQGPATPITDDPDIDTGDEKEDGWLFGILEYPASIAFDGLSPGEQISLTNIRLANVGSDEAGILQPFDAGDILRGWTSETDNTYLTPCLWLYSDHKQVAAWPYRAHVVPLSGSGNYYVYWTLDTLKTYVDHIPGWTATVEAAQTYPHLDGDSSTKLRSGTILAGNLESYAWTGDTAGVPNWQDQTALSLPASIYACVRADEVSAYPGCGDPSSGYGASNLVFPLRVSKVLRAQAEGLAPSGQSVRLERTSNGSNRGTDAAGSDGYYRTGAPFGFGNVDHLARLLQGGQPFEGSFKCQNRNRHRTSFLEAVESTGTGPAYDVSESMRHIRGFVSGGTMWVGRTDNTLASWDDFDTAVAAESLAVQILKEKRSQEVWMLVEDGGSVKLYKSLDFGGTWTLATTIATGGSPALLASRDGRVYLYWVDGTDVKGQVRDMAGSVLTSTFTAVSGIDSGTGIAVDERVPGNGMRAVVLLCVVGGSITQYLSYEGKTFS